MAEPVPEGAALLTQSKVIGIRCAFLRFWFTFPALASVAQCALYCTLPAIIGLCCIAYHTLAVGSSGLGTITALQTAEGAGPRIVELTGRITF